MNQAMHKTTRTSPLIRATVTAANGLNAVVVDVTHPDKTCIRYTVNCNVKHVNFGQVRALIQNSSLAYEEVAVFAEHVPTKQQLFAALSKVLDATVAARLLPELRI